MNTATWVGAFGAFGAGLVVAFGAALGTGRLVGPLDAPASPAAHTDAVRTAAFTADAGAAAP